MTRLLLLSHNPTVAESNHKARETSASEDRLVLEVNVNNHAWAYVLGSAGLVCEGSCEYRSGYSS